MKLIVTVPKQFEPEISYTAKILFQRLLGIHLDFENSFESKSIVVRGPEKKQLVFPTVGFKKMLERPFRKVNCPSLPLSFWTESEVTTELGDCLLMGGVPVLYGDRLLEGGWTKVSENKIEFGADLFASAFFMLSRFEEYIEGQRDTHSRFSAKDSTAYMGGFLNRPLVNEYAELLWSAVRKLWPGFARKMHEFKILPSHDVDRPFRDLLLPPSRLARRLASDLIKRRDLIQFGTRLVKSLNHRNLEEQKRDPFNTFDWMLERMEKFNLKTSFNFMAGGKTIYDHPYSLKHPAIQNLFSKIKDAGHEIGFHPSHKTFESELLWLHEKESLEKASGVRLKGGRQHYLRFSPLTTWRVWNRHGFQYDSSLGFADQAGFRAGICHDYPVYDLEERIELLLLERPLIMMECSVLDTGYMGFELPEAVDYAKELKGVCRKFGGNFTILWHNSELYNDALREAFDSILGETD